MALAVLVVALGATSAQAAPFVYVTNAGGAGRWGNLSQYDAARGPLVPLSPATVGTGNDPIGVAASPDGKSVYVTTGEPAVLQFSIGATGSLTLKSSATVPVGALPGQPAVSPDGRSVYTINDGGFQPLLQYTVGPDGALTLKSPPTVPTGPGPTQLAISPDSRNVYVTNTVMGLSTVSQYTAAADGTLSPKSPPNVPIGSNDPFAEPVGVEVSPNGKNVYVANSEARDDLSGTVVQFTVSADGTLAPKSPATVLAGKNPYEVATSPDGQSVYVTDADSPGTVLQYTVGATGALTPKSPAVAPAGAIPLGIAVTSDGHSAYAANAGSDTLSQYAVAADGRLSARSPPAVAAGANPLEIAVSPAPPVPTSKEQCKHGGWRNFPRFNNQGQCVAFVERGPKG
jgi:DNA-binding beta-propeller fold protein YncE